VLVRATSAERALDPQPESLGRASNGFEDQSIELGWIAELMGCSEQRLWLGWRQGKRGTARLVQLTEGLLAADQYRPPDSFDTSTPRIPSTSYHPNRARPRGRVCRATSRDYLLQVVSQTCIPEQACLRTG